MLACGFPSTAEHPSQFLDPSLIAKGLDTRQRSAVNYFLRDEVMPMTRRRARGTLRRTW